MSLDYCRNTPWVTSAPCWESLSWMISIALNRTILERRQWELVQEVRLKKGWSKFPTDLLVYCKMLWHSHPLFYWTSLTHSSWHQRQEARPQTQEITNYSINCVWSTGKPAKKNPMERKDLRHMTVMCPLNKITESENRDWPEYRVLDWVRHLEDKIVRFQCVSVWKSPWGVAI